MVSLNYLGISPDSDLSEKKGQLVVSATSCKSIIDSFPATRSKVRSFIQDGWEGGFVGTNGYLATSAANPQQKTLSALLDYKNNALNPCIQYSAVTTEMAKYIKSKTQGSTESNQVGVANGVASLDSAGKIPVAQLPSMGDGYVVGPLGCSPVAILASGGTASGIAGTPGPLKFAEWAIQTTPDNFQPIVFMCVLVEQSPSSGSPLGRPVIEVRISNGPVTTYSTSNPLVATGTGRNYFTGAQPVSVMPCAPSRGQTPSFYPPTYNTYLTAWLYDAGSGVSSISSTTSSIISAAAFLVKVES